MNGFSPKRLEETLVEKGLSQAELARMMQVSPASLSRILRGLRSPGSRFIANLRTAFPDKPLEHFFEFHDQKQS